MGEKFKREQAKGYRQREDAAYPELTEPTLITACRRTEYKSAYRCRVAADAPVLGTKVWLNVSEGKVRVYEATNFLGEVYCDEGAELARLVSEEMQGMARATVDTVSPLGDFTITCESEGGDDDE